MSVFVLKIIACVTMLIDHFGAAIMMPALGDPWDVDTYWLLRGIGRIAFPIFAYLIAQGCVHTKNIGKYLLRLGLLAIISEPFFSIAFRGGNIDFLRNTNIFYTLFLGVAAIAICQKIREMFTGSFGEIASVFAVIPAMVLAGWLNSDYSFYGVGIIFLIYIMHPESRMGRSVALSLGMVALYFDNLDFLIFSLVAVGLIALYDGKPGPNSAAIKWGFYFFYPAHIAALIALRMIFFQ